MRWDTFFLLLAFAGAASADAGLTLQPGKRATPEELAARQREMMARDAELRKDEPEQTDTPALSRPKSLLERSDILSFGKTATLVPKGALLRVPANLADRIGLQPGSRMVGWVDFQSANRGWVTTVEITLAQAEGKEPFPESLRQHLAASGNIVVATYEGGPVSVLPLRASETTAATRP